MKEIAKAYNHLEVEEALYRNWEEKGYFKPEVNPKGEPFCIIMPPPNANGSLHLGHAVFITLEDIMTRFARLQGKAALWLPGADHAGFETQTVFEKKLEKEGTNRFELTREELYKRTLEFTLTNKKLMESQLKRLGASCDWSREKFTLDPDIIEVVYKTFKKLYDDGLAYRGTRPVNWCTKHQTSLSDLEIKYEEQVDPLFYLKYQIVSQLVSEPVGQPKELILATVRPETMFGDTAVAVNPKDVRYKDLIGQEVVIPLTNTKVKIVADEYVDIKFGTGVVKITPAHDPNDFEVAKRHNLEIKEVIDKFGRMNEIAGPYKGMKIKEARQKVVEDMQKKGLIEKIDAEYTHSVSKCYRCGNVIEPRVLPQWFIAVNKKGEETGKTLAKDAIDAVKKGDVKFVTEKFEKIYKHWMSNIRDWNVSRQIVWGIRLPVWYRKQAVISNSKFLISNQFSNNKCPNDQINDKWTMENDKSNIYVGVEPPKDIENWEQDPDVFDTWFSSGQWPFATLQTQKSVDDFKKFYPTTVMETGWDILFFWVARMIMLGLYATDKVPFENVYMHGLVRDKDRQKMSKSKGNVIDPLGVAEIYGSDAVRMALVFGTSAGNDAVISEEKIKGMRNFANKIWNASRFVLLQTTGGNLQTGELGDEVIDNFELGDAEIKNFGDILSNHQKTIDEVTKNLEKYNFSLAAEEIYSYFWHDFCDDYIEKAKALLADDSSQREVTKKILIRILTDSLTMLHPFMPYVTEAVWQELRKVCDKLPESVMIAKWPKS